MYHLAVFEKQWCPSEVSLALCLLCAYLRISITLGGDVYTPESVLVGSLHQYNVVGQSVALDISGSLWSTVECR